jgi:hypothetical protein
VKEKCYTSNYWGDWNHFKTVQTVPDQHTRKAQNEGTTKTKKNTHIGHCTHTAESATVKLQNIFHGKNNVKYSTNCTYTTAGTLL